MGKSLYLQPYATVREQNLSVISEYYEQKQMGPLLKDETIFALRKRLEFQVAVSDVIVLNKEGVISAYYMDVDGAVVVIAGFIRSNVEMQPMLS